MVRRYLASAVLWTATDRPWRPNEDRHRDWIQGQCVVRPQWTGLLNVRAFVCEGTDCGLRTGRQEEREIQSVVRDATVIVSGPV